MGERRKRLLVTGASGLLGVSLCLDAVNAFEVIGVVNSRRLAGAPFSQIQADFTQPGSAARLIEEVRPDWVVHCAALADLDACEKNPALSARLNANLPGEVAEACRKTGARLAHISTDAVFDGERGGYREDDQPNPQSVYARDKWLGEQAVLQANPQAVVARVNFYGWSLLGQRSLAEKFYYTLAAGKGMMGFTDVYFCPLVNQHLGRILLEMLEKGLEGLYHVFSAECQSKYAFGVALAKRFGLDAGLIRPVSVQEAGLAARRSPNLTMRVEKLEAALGHAMPGQEEELEAFHRLYLEGYPQRLRAMVAVA